MQLGNVSVPNSGKLSQLAQKAFPMSNMIENILVCDGSPGLAESGASRLLSDDADGLFIDFVGHAYGTLGPSRRFLLPCDCVVNQWAV